MCVLFSGFSLVCFCFFLLPMKLRDPEEIDDLNPSFVYKRLSFSLRKDIKSFCFN